MIKPDSLKHLTGQSEPCRRPAGSGAGTRRVATPETIIGNCPGAVKSNSMSTSPNETFISSFWGSENGGSVIFRGELYNDEAKFPPFAPMQVRAETRAGSAQ
jgi:hypothetical protein